MKYIKKPIVIDAIEFTGNNKNINELSRFMNIKNLKTIYKNKKLTIEIHTLEGIMIATIGDYIIKGINGEFYPCKPDIFKKTYDEI